MCESCLPTGGLTRRQTLAAAAGVIALANVRWRRPSPSVDQVEVTPGLSIWPREAWATDRPPKPGLQPEPDVRFLLVHHTASSNTYAQDRAPDVMRQTYDFHTGPTKGWPDVCYNFFVDRYGGAWEGRAGSLNGPVRADGTGGSQGFDQLVCLIGDFTHEMPSDAALDTTRRTLAWLADRYAIDTAPEAVVTFVSRGSNRWPAGASVTAPTISGHRDMSQTACPGDAFYPYVHKGLAADVNQFRTIAPPVPGTLTTTAETPASSLAPATTAAPPTTVTAPASTAAPATSADPTTTSAPTTTAAPTTTIAPTTTTNPADAASTLEPSTSTTTAASAGAANSTASAPAVSSETTTTVENTTHADSGNRNVLIGAAGALAVLGIAGGVVANRQHKGED